MGEAGRDIIAAVGLVLFGVSLTAIGIVALVCLPLVWLGRGTVAMGRSVERLLSEGVRR